MRELIIDRSHFSGTDLDIAIVEYAEKVYDYQMEKLHSVSDSEEWLWEADEAFEFMNDIEQQHGRYFEIEDNSLFLVEGEDDE